jgi:hypothetical protein
MPTAVRVPRINISRHVTGATEDRPFRDPERRRTSISSSSVVAQMALGMIALHVPKFVHPGQLLFQQARSIYLLLWRLKTPRYGVWLSISFALQRLRIAYLK